MVSCPGDQIGPVDSASLGTEPNRNATPASGPPTRIMKIPLLRW